jgi:DNA-binding NarL/FixJ family response regulator
MLVPNETTPFPELLMSITLIVADAHPVVHAGILSLVAGKGIRIVASANSGDEAMKLITKFKPDVAMIEVQLPGGDGLNCLARLLVKKSPTRVLMFAASENPTYVARSLAIGAFGYATKGTAQGQLIAMIKKVASGDKVWTREQLRMSTGACLLPADIPGGNHLTNRELEVLKQVALGLTNKEIAMALGISYETVKEHVQHILKKLNLSDRTQAAVWAVRNKAA